MHTRLEEADPSGSRLAAFYAERAAGGAGLIVTGGISPNAAGVSFEGGARLDCESSMLAHRHVTSAVHRSGGRIALQILHAGRYGVDGLAVAPSALRSPISSVTPREMSASNIRETIGDYARCAALAESAGYDGVEIMAGEGYLPNLFLAPRTNRRVDEWGGDLAHRMRFTLEVTAAVRGATRPDFAVILRLSLLDLVEDGCDWREIVELARQGEEAGADAISTSIGWHEARAPTIATLVPRAAFTWVTRRLKGEVAIPLITSHRINDPVVAETVISRGDADMVSLARPFLADPHFSAKARAGDLASINTCIACNQACLDHYFSEKVASCLVNPLACRETEIVLSPTMRPRRVAVVGAGPAGLAFAASAAEVGHKVTLFEAGSEVGGQFNLAKLIPGKEEFSETIRYFRHRVDQLGVETRLNHRVSADDLAYFDHVALATGVLPRRPEIDGIDHPSVASYADVLLGRRRAGANVAIIGAGGIGFDVAEFLSHREGSGADEFYEEWGIDRAYTRRGGLTEPRRFGSTRQVWLLQRRRGAVGKDLGRSTGWIKRSLLARRGVEMIDGSSYERIDDEGLHITSPSGRRLLPADTIVVCAGQESERSLVSELAKLTVPFSVVGGAHVAAELDAKRAIEHGTRAALTL